MASEFKSATMAASLVALIVIFFGFTSEKQQIAGERGEGFELHDEIIINVEEAYSAPTNSSSSPKERAGSTAKPNHQLRAAILFTGHIRAFEMKEVRTSQLKGIIEPLVVKGYKVWLFFATGNGDAFRNRPLFQGASPDVVREWITSEWNSTDGEGYIQAIQFEVYEDRAAVPQHYRQHCDWKSRATHLLDLDRFWHTWRRVRHTYRMATAFEDASGFKFDIMVRLRPDLLFLKEGDTSSIEGFLSNPVSAEKDSRGSSVVYTPPAKFIFGQATNDWVYLCQRSLCDSYFEMISPWEKCEVAAKGPRMCCSAWEPFYERTMEIARLSIKEIEDLFPVLPMRKGFIECNRLGAFPSLLKACYEKAKELGIKASWTCKNGKGELIIARTCGLNGDLI
mmetsp:Transcript_42654/g.68715  ORF Transcript_42654/g.68715 Transcript_42654/m.68715 type:complete len:395 (-) Transcript_42654:150-1334(-)